MKITFLGAAHEVTGSRTLLEVGDKKGLVDYGMEQGRDLFENDELAQKHTRLEKSIDKIRDKYGSDVIRRGNLIAEKDDDFDEESKPFKRQ